ncbi:hypothetical protein PhaeoP66_03200 [Phaeobacter inhibens]|uniref:Uncharacterized protein n=1 Tax=Phaeobacter inhibens TaxID=221822 RepID=A0ABN5GR08_9RHOB|nr:hypothetical protein PhaeoP66_03200 [Phaeobacter inhibens]
MDALASLFMPVGLRPYDPDAHAPRDLGFGGQSTEYLTTNDAPDGGAWNIPQVWWTGAGAPVVLGPDQAQNTAIDYERVTGRKFPRFETPGAGSFAAMNRSAAGGAQTNPLASFFGGNR